MGRPDPIVGEAALVFRYVISSTEMRHIERAERRVFLGAGMDGRLRLWGEIAGCGEACHADLAALLLEYAMSCERLPEADQWEQASRAFAGQIRAAITAALAQHAPEAAPEERARRALEGLLWSMQALVAPPDQGRSGSYRFADCPLCAAAAANGTLRVAEMAHGLFGALCRTTVQAAAPGWTVSSGNDLARPEHALELSLQAEEPG